MCNLKKESILNVSMCLLTKLIICINVVTDLQATDDRIAKLIQRIRAGDINARQLGNAYADFLTYT